MAALRSNTIDREFAGHWAAIDHEVTRRAMREEQARRDAHRHIIADLPDPAMFARYLSLHLSEALLGAVNNGHYGWIVAEIHAAELRSLGLVGFGRGQEGRGVTAFGWAVRTALKAEDA